MNHKTDTAIRIGLLVMALLAVMASFAVAADDAVTRSQRFLALASLSLVAVIAFGLGEDVIQGYTKRRPLRLRWGKPATELEPAIDGPQRVLPDEWRVTSGLRYSKLIAGLAASLAAVLILGVLGYAWAGSASQYGSGLFLYVALAVAVWLTFRFLIKALFGRRVIEVHADRVTLGIGAGYLPPLTIARQEVVGIEISREREVIAFVTRTRRFELSTSMIDNPELAAQLAGLWPDVTWHELSPHAVRTSLSLP